MSALFPPIKISAFVYYGLYKERVINTVKEKIQMTNKINGGAFQIARKIFDSWIWTKPPYYLKLWIWLIGKCNYQEKKKYGMTFKKGECLVTLKETQEQTKYMAGWRTEEITKDQAWNFYEDCRKQNMVQTRKTTKGMFVRVLSYNRFQTLANYENNKEYNNEDDKKTTVDQQHKQEREERKNKIEDISSRAQKPEQEKSIKEKKFGREEINIILATFKREFGFPPIDKNVRRVAWNIYQMISATYRKRNDGKNPDIKIFKRQVDWLFNRFWEEDFADKTRRISTVKDHLKVYLAEVKNGGLKRGEKRELKPNEYFAPDGKIKKRKGGGGE